MSFEPHVLEVFLTKWAEMDWYHFTALPLYIQEMLLLNHKTRLVRVKLFHFLWLNGLSPRIIPDIIMFNGGYDKDAWRDIDGMVKKALLIDSGHGDGDNSFANYPYYDMILGYVVNNNN